MALISCKECGNQVADSAKQCPSCGAKIKKSSFLRKIGIGFGVLMLIGAMSSAFVGGSGTSIPTAQKDKKPTMNQMAAGCQVEWEMQMKSKLKDPDSLDWDVRNAELGMYKEKAVIAVPYRARNSFNAQNLERAICQINPETGDIKAVLK